MEAYGLERSAQVQANSPSDCSTIILPMFFQVFEQLNSSQKKKIVV